MPAKQTNSGATTGYEAELWAIAGNLEALGFGGRGP